MSLFLFDSGSSLSLVSQKYINQLPGKIDLEPCNINSNSATFERIPIFAKVNLSLDIKGRQMQHTFVVARKLPFPCIFGNDLLGRLNPLCIDYIQRTVSVAHNTFPFDEFCKKQHNCHTLICFQETKRIPAMSDFVGFGRPCESLPSKNLLLDQCVFPVRASAVNCEFPDSISEVNILVEPTLTTVRNGQVPVRLINQNDFDIEIPAHTPVASAEMIDPRRKIRPAHFHSDDDVILSIKPSDENKEKSKENEQLQSASDKKKLLLQLDETVKKAKCDPNSPTIVVRYVEKKHRHICPQ